MESINRKDELMEKYWLGETSVLEEQELQTLVTPEDGALYDIFNGMSDLMSKEISIDVRALVAKAGPPTQKTRVLSIKPIFKVLSYAAVFALLVYGTTWIINTNDSSIQYAAEQETFEDPDLALEQTKEALAFVFNKMNKGQAATVNNVKRVETLDDIIPN
jgi:hypothetical protein